MLAVCDRVSQSRIREAIKVLIGQEPNQALLDRVVELVRDGQAVSGAVSSCLTLNKS